MGVNYNPQIVTSGLTLALDAANPKSYPGTGTTWSDLSGNSNNGTLTNGPTYTTNNAGALIFDGSNDHIASFATQLSGTGSKSIGVWFLTTSAIRQGLCGTRVDAVSNQGWVFLINRTTAGNLTYFVTGGSEIELAAGITTNTWYYAVVTYASSVARLYINGKFLGSVSGFTAPSSSTYNGTIGGEGQSSLGGFAGRISNLQIYNRLITAEEVLENFNAQRGRYGI
jgi:hypothetical protein